MSAPRSVVLLRDLPEEERVSMERFADELEQALIATGGWTVRPYRPEFRARATRFGSRIKRFAAYPLAARRLKADVFHVIDHGYADLALVLPRVHTVVTCHDLMLLRAAEGASGLAGGRLVTARFRFSVRQLAKVAHVACDSNATRADVIRLVGVEPARTSVVPPGLSPRFRPPQEPVDQLRARLGLSGQVILHVDSGAGAYKNVEGVFGVLARLRARGFAVTLARAGRRLVHKELQGVPQGCVRDFGFVSDERLVELYQAADVLLFPSYHEGFGWPVLEAMACGTPVVASTQAALAETVADAGLLAPATDTEALADAVARVLDDGGLSTTLRERGLRRAADFSWARTARAYAEIYTELSERPRPA
jgi:glycosyltransferase involved in cell wall biosynthesis